MMCKLININVAIFLVIAFFISGCSNLDNNSKIKFNNVFNPDIGINEKEIKSHLDLMPKIDLPLYMTTIVDTVFVFEVYETVVSQSWRIRNFTESNDSIDLWLSNYDCISMTEIDSQNNFAIWNYKNNVMMLGEIIRGDSSLIVKYYFPN